MDDEIAKLARATGYLAADKRYKKNRPQPAPPGDGLPEHGVALKDVKDQINGLPVRLMTVWRVWDGDYTSRTAICVEDENGHPTAQIDFFAFLFYVIKHARFRTETGEAWGVAMGPQDLIDQINAKILSPPPDIANE